MLKLVVVLALAACAAGNDFCSKGDTYHNIYRVGLNTCPCTKENVGALRFRHDVLEVCNSEGKYVAVGGGGGGSKEEIGSKGMPATSCREILKAKPDAKSGMFFLKKGASAEAAYCHMGELCGEKGWTMILKADGNKGTFSYDSKVWTNQDIINPAGAAGGLNEQETKLHTYHTFRFDRLCIGMKTGGIRKWQKLNYYADSLYSVIRGDVYHPTHIGRNAWKKLIPGSSLQRNCNKEGFNVNKGSKAKGPARVRIGIIGNQENDCNTPDSRIGIGGAGQYCGQDKSNSVGNTARCSPDNGDRNIKSFGYVFAAEGINVGSHNNPGASCKDIKIKNKNAENGVYYLKFGNQKVKTYCQMDNICGSSGWSMIMKLNGAKRTFRYDSSYWKNKATYNPSAVQGGLDNLETKLDSYHLLPFNNLCVGMKVGNGAIRWLKVPKKAGSLYSLIADGRYRATNLGRNAWKRLLKDGSLQRHCNKEGFNAYHRGERARIGIISNQENNCRSPDSRIAFGGEGGHCGTNNNHSVGNEARCSPDNGDKSTVAFGYIMAQ